jgi:hypothetical protein
MHFKGISDTVLKNSVFGIKYMDFKKSQKNHLRILELEAQVASLKVQLAHAIVKAESGVVMENAESLPSTEWHVMVPWEADHPHWEYFVSEVCRRAGVDSVSTAFVAGKDLVLDLPRANGHLLVVQRGQRGVQVLDISCKTNSSQPDLSFLPDFDMKENYNLVQRSDTQISILRKIGQFLQWTFTAEHLLFSDDVLLYRFRFFVKNEKPSDFNGTKKLSLRKRTLSANDIPSHHSLSRSSRVKVSPLEDTGTVTGESCASSAGNVGSCAASGCNENGVV